MGNSSDGNPLPRQGGFLGRRVRVAVDAADKLIGGTVVRDDAEPPGLVVVELDDGRRVSAAECQHFGPDWGGAT